MPVYETKVFILTQGRVALAKKKKKKRRLEHESSGSILQLEDAPVDDGGDDRTGER